MARRANKEEETRIRLLKKLLGRSDLGEFFYMAYLGFLLRRRRVPEAAKNFPILAKMMRWFVEHPPHNREQDFRAREKKLVAKGSRMGETV